MKAHHIVFTIVLLCVYSCKKDPSRDQPYKDALIGSWRISEWTNNYDTSINYDGYTLVFTADGKLQATDLNSATSAGTWYEFSYENIPEYKVRLQIEGAQFYLLNSTWTFITHSSSRIDFEILSYGSHWKMSLLRN